MEMEVAMPIPAMDFNFDSNCSSPYMTAPSSPQRFGNFYFSAPTSPSRVTAFCRELNERSLVSTSDTTTSSTEAFNVQQEDHYSISNKDIDGDGEDFEFNFSGQLERSSLSADELFDGGKIRPLKLQSSFDSSSRSSSSRSRSTSQKMKDAGDPSGELIKQQEAEEERTVKQQEQRGRERIAGCSRKGSRSLSPMRVTDIIYEQEDNTSQTAKIVSSTTANNNNTTKSYAASILSSISFSKTYKKWKLKDLLLFRSASEGRATRTDSLRKYAVLSKNGKDTEDVKNASFRSTDSSGSVSRRRGPVSAHELHYTANRAVSEELKRKTFLPYKQGLLGCLGFNPGVHDISRGIGSLPRG